MTERLPERLIIGSTRGRPAGSSNLPGLDYRREATAFLKPTKALIDIHSHITGARAAAVYREVARLYGVGLTYSMTPLPHVEAVKDLLGPAIRFIAIPNWGATDKAHAYRQGMLEDLEVFSAKHNAKMLKFWNAPRFREMFPGDAGSDLVELDSPWRIRTAELAQSLGMMFMAHIADPDTWFKTKYADAKIYKTKAEQYVPLERMLDRFPAPWIAAHMGGWPEDLKFLSGLLERHPNLHLDCSATKWIVREISKHPREEFLAFMTRWKERIMFGSDIVTTDDHVVPAKQNPNHPKADQANSPESAFDLYASRYWALRAMLESDFEGPSPIADGDLKMVEPTRYTDTSSPMMRGFGLPREILERVYWGNAERVVGGWERKNP